MVDILEKDWNCKYISKNWDITSTLQYVYFLQYVPKTRLMATPIMSKHVPVSISYKVVFVGYLFTQDGEAEPSYVRKTWVSNSGKNNSKLVIWWLHLKYDGTRWCTGGEVKGKLASGVSSQYPSHYLGTWCIHHYYRWCAHLGCQ